ncbi:MAG: type II toxin-antitoxin system RelE/ParE family toxin [Rhodospirillaceae bacterium]|nr:type II toxin-antitoxin system RelE/ParE family toxin [Rhodospirillaceae bacterium]
MAGYRLTQKATDDLNAIYEYTTVNFGLEQAQNYLSGLHGRFEELATHPVLGRNAEPLAPGLRRYPYRSHVVFYVPEDQGVLIVRILHESMEPRRHFILDS